jgi:hypothetical protein
VEPTPNTAHVAQGLALFTSQFSAEGAPQLRAQTASYLAEAQELEDTIWKVLSARRLATAKVYSPLSSFSVANGNTLVVTSFDLTDLVFVGSILTFASQPGVSYLVTFADYVPTFGGMILLSSPYTGTTNGATTATQPLTNSVLDGIGALVGQQRLGLNDLDYLTAIYLRIAVNRSGGRQSDWSNFVAILLRTSDGPVLYFESGTAGTGVSSAFYLGVWGMTLNPNVVALVLSSAVPDAEGPNCFAWTTWPDGEDYVCDSVYAVTDDAPDFTAILGLPLSRPGNIEPGALFGGFSLDNLGWGSVYDPNAGGWMVAASQM